jgi:hypothetical protein
MRRLLIIMPFMIVACAAALGYALCTNEAAGTVGFAICTAANTALWIKALIEKRRSDRESLGADSGE